MHATTHQEVQRARAVRTRRRRVLAGLSAILLVAEMLSISPATADDSAPGSTPDAAAVSCWDIKQQVPAATDGSYWLLTPAMPAPAQFHCDMTTDGGGWVLIGRGREGWNFSYNGQGTSDEVRTAVEGPAAFVPRTLAATVVDGLLNGGRVDQVPDGVRVRRALNTEGTSWQEVQFDLASRDRWVWAFEAGHPLSTWRFDTRSGSGGVTREFGLDSYYRRVQTTKRQSHGYRAGWGYGSRISGTSASTSYLWSQSSEGNALPFAQVYLRPRLTAADVDFPAIPDTGLAPQAQRPLLSNLAEPGEWGVTGRANGGTSELDSEVQAFAQSGNRMIVGGNFRDVQKGEAASGSDKVEQSYLAAFDVATGAWLDDFRPVLDGQVKDLVTLPDGRVVAAGEFSTVNGAPAPGLVAIDPLTGATDPSFRVSVENRISDGPGHAVMALDAEGPWLYLGGRFTHLTGGSRPTAVYARNGARVSITDGTPDAGWNPDLNGTALDVDASEHRDRTYFAGYFTTSKGSSAPQVAVVDTAPGADLVPGLGSPSFSSTRRYQQAIREVGGRLWHGGAQHMLFSYARDDLSRLSGNITRIGGDFQVIADHHGTVYGGCHCQDFNYSDAYTWTSSGVDPNWTQGDNIRYAGAWDASTGRYIPEFVPELRAARGQGPWEMVADDTGTMWMGGDVSRARTRGGRWQWVSGFVRFAQRDSTPPAVPGPVHGGDRAGTTTLAWATSTDDSGSVSYELLRDDRVVATTWDTQIALATVPRAARYFVRAVDAAGNRSGTTAVRTVVPDVDPPEPLPYEVLATWSSTTDLFSGATGTPASVEVGGAYGERLRWTQQEGEAAYRYWSGRRLGAPSDTNTLRWVSEFSAWPSASFVVAQGADDVDGFRQRWRIDLTAAGRLRIRDGANALTAEASTPLPLGTELRFEAVRDGTSMTVSVYDPASSTTPLVALSGAVGTGVNHIRLGQVLRTPTVPTHTLDEVVLTDHAGALDPPVELDPPVAPAPK